LQLIQQWGGVALTKDYKIQVHAFSFFIFYLNVCYVLNCTQSPLNISLKKKKIQDKCSQGSYCIHVSLLSLPQFTGSHRLS